MASSSKPVVKITDVKVSDAVGVGRGDLHSSESLFQAS